MAFRCGFSSVRCLVYDLDDLTKRCIVVNRPTVFALNIALQNENNRSVFVRRKDKLFTVKTNRDVEELGGGTGEDIVYVSVNIIGTHFKNALPLSRYQLNRLEIPAKLDTFGDCVLSSSNILANGKIIQYGLRKHGFFRIRLSDYELEVVNRVFEEIKWFTNQNQTFKNQYAYHSIGSDQTQPEFGYRQTDLNKQYFVCRKLSKQLQLQYPSKQFENRVNEYIETMGFIAKYALGALLKEFGCNRYHIRGVLDGTLKNAESLETVGFTSMTELFRYDCSGYSDESYNIRIPCGDHVDVSLFTIIPASQGTAGLEIFDWYREWLRVEEQTQIFENECIVFPGELLQRLTAGRINATPHRVVVEVGENVQDRLSCPFELLLHPHYQIDCGALFQNKALSDEYAIAETSQNYISRISTKLVSVNK